jgi:ABC-type branched-subunit amino acid transport system ATPase component
LNEPLLALDGVTRRFGGALAADGVSFSLAAGELVSLIGPNGAGKSTLVNLIAGRLAPDAGCIRLRGAPLPASAWRAARLGVGRLFQEVRLCGRLSVLENVLLGPAPGAGEGLAAALLAPRRVRREEAERRERALAELAFVGLADRAESLAGALSYGQGKLVALARLLASSAELLLLDEPASGLNPRLIEQLAQLLDGITARGRTVLLVEHNLGLVQAVSRRLLLLDRGRLAADGPAAEVLASAAMRGAYYL